MKKFIREGNLYKMKTQWSMNIPLIAAIALISIVGFTTHLPGLGWTMLVITLILVIATCNSFLIIDTDLREIRSKMGFAAARTIPFDQLQGFTVHKTRYIIFTINVSLIANYINEQGKEKEQGLVQHFFTRPVQYVLNDIDEILEHEHKR